MMPDTVWLLRAGATVSTLPVCALRSPAKAPDVMPGYPASRGSGRSEALVSGFLALDVAGSFAPKLQRGHGGPIRLLARSSPRAHSGPTRECKHQSDHVLPANCACACILSRHPRRWCEIQSNGHPKFLVTPGAWF